MEIICKLYIAVPGTLVDTKIFLRYNYKYNKQGALNFELQVTRGTGGCDVWESRGVSQCEAHEVDEAAPRRPARSTLEALRRHSRQIAARRDGRERRVQVGRAPAERAVARRATLLICGSVSVHGAGTGWRARRHGGWVVPPAFAKYIHPHSAAARGGCARGASGRGRRWRCCVCAESGGSEMSGGSGDARRPSTCRVELGALLAPEPRPLDNKVKVRNPGRARLQAAPRRVRWLLSPDDPMSLSIVSVRFPLQKSQNCKRYEKVCRGHLKWRIACSIYSLASTVLQNYEHK